MHSEVRAPRKITNSEGASSSLAFYDGILTPSDASNKQAEASPVTFKKPVYGPAERY